MVTSQRECWGLTRFRFHLSKFLSAVASILNFLCALEETFFKFMSFLCQIYFICLV